MMRKKEIFGGFFVEWKNWAELKWSVFRTCFPPLGTAVSAMADAFGKVGAVGAVSSQGISGAAARLLNTKAVRLEVHNRSGGALFNLKKYGDMSTLEGGPAIRSGERGAIVSQGVKSAAGVMALRSFKFRAGHLGYFLILPVIKNDFLHFLLTL